MDKVVCYGLIFYLLISLLLGQAHYRGRSPARERDRERGRDSHRYRYVFLLDVVVHLTNYIRPVCIGC